MRWAIGSMAVLAVLSACATPPTPAPQRTAPAAPSTGRPAPPTPPPTQGQAAAPLVELRAVAFSALPGWREADLEPALAAFRRSCATLPRRADADRFGRLSAYGGTVGEWRSVCAAATMATDARSFFEANFIPQEVAAPADAMRRLTGYYEPVIEARTSPEPGFDEPFLARPIDLVSIDLTRFDEATELSASIARSVADGLPADLAAAKGLVETAVESRLERRFRTPLWGRIDGGRVVPYAPRAAIDRGAGALAYARPCDVYDVQVQGSARVRFPDGRDLRMAYAAQNGFGWRSIYGQLRDRGTIAQPTKQAVCDFLAAQPPQEVKAALDLDPSYVFFSLEPIGDPAAGPRGAQGVPLTPLGSIAVDPAVHPYGVPIFVAPEGEAPIGPRLLIAQDTGGAIRRGALRGDVFFGTGVEAGVRATAMNTPALFWTLLPRATVPPIASLEGAPPPRS